jgi:hypothetical protein
MLKRSFSLLLATASIALPTTIVSLTAVTLTPQSAQAMCAAPTTLTGVWRANDGGTYTVRESGSSVVWRGKSADDGRTWNHIFRGTRTGNTIVGNWEDQPSGRIRSRGILKLQVRTYGRAIEGFSRTEATGGFGGSKWWKPCNDVELNPV